MTIYPVPPLFSQGMPPAENLARRTDPETSKRAARSMITSGKLGAHCARVLSVVRKYPRMTAPELAQWCGLDRYEVSRRLADLERQTLAKKAGRRACGVHGTSMSVWEAT